MKKFLKLLFPVLLMLSECLLSGCDKSSEDSNHIKVGVISGAKQDIAEVAKQVALKKYGLHVELVVFSDPLLLNELVVHKELDANVFRHQPFLEQENKARGHHLVAVAKTFLFPMAGYTRKIYHVSELKNGDTIAIPDDPGNLGRALLLLQKEKLIVLREGSGLLPTLADITSNPLSLNIIGREGVKLFGELDNPKVTVAVIAATHIQQTGLSPSRDSLFIEDKNSPYVNIIMAREDNKNAENVTTFIKSYQSPEVAAVADVIFNGGAIKGW